MKCAMLICFAALRGLAAGHWRCDLSRRLTAASLLSRASPAASCLTCRQIENMQYSDLLVVQAEQEGGTLKVDQIRELQHSLALAPYQGRYKVALLLRFEEAHPSAMNALLKTLEEPAPQVIILLTADSPENLLPTIVSRCEVLRLRPISLEQVSQGLQDRSGLPRKSPFTGPYLGRQTGSGLSLHPAAGASRTARSLAE